MGMSSPCSASGEAVQGGSLSQRWGYLVEGSPSGRGETGLCQEAAQVSSHQFRGSDSGRHAR